MGSSAHLSRLIEATSWVTIGSLPAIVVTFLLEAGACPMHLFLLLAAVATLYMYIVRRPRRVVYLVEYACFRTVPSCRAPSAMFLEHTHLLHGALDEDRTAAVDSFMAGVLERSGLGEETTVPPSLRYVPPDKSLHAARKEAELVVFSAVDALLAKTATRPGDVDAVIICCSMCAPELALSNMIVNRYAIRSDVRSTNLSGMGVMRGSSR